MRRASEPAACVVWPRPNSEDVLRALRKSARPGVVNTVSAHGVSACCPLYRVTAKSAATRRRWRAARPHRMDTPPPSVPSPSSAKPAAQRLRGMVIMFFGVLAISPDAMFVRLMRAEVGNSVDANLQITFWKYLLLIPLQSIYSIWHAGSCRDLVERLWAGPLHLLAGGLCQVGISISLNLGYVMTVAARAHLFFALSPLWAALFSRVFLKDRLRRSTLVALLMAIASIFVVFIPSVFTGLDDHNRSGAGEASNASSAGSSIEASLGGDLLGLLAGASLGALIVVSASAKRRCPDAPMLATIVVGSSLVVLISLAWQTAAERASMATVSWRFMGFALADSICICIVCACNILELYRMRLIRFLT